MVFLGFAIATERVRLVEGNVREICEWPTTKTIIKAQSFHELATFYQRLIRHFSTIMASTTKYTKNKNFHWNEEAMYPFVRTKEQ